MQEYEVVRSKRKTIALQVNEELKVIVRAPLRYPEKRIEKFVEANSAWIENAIEKQKKRTNNKIELSDNEIKKVKAYAKVILVEKVEYYSRIMNVQPTSVKITSAKTRFGSCSGKNAICFSYILMLYPEQAIDYVVVHELAHIKYHNHGTNFYKFIESVLPDYKKREKMLKDSQIMPSFVK